MHAFVLAGGRGVRLRPYTSSLPKPLVPIGDKYSILEIVLMQLAAQGFERVTVSIGYLGHLIRSFVGDGSRWGLEIDFATEELPLGTMGPVRMHVESLPEHFLVMNGDILTDLNFAGLLANHIRSGSGLTVATYRREVKIDFGVLDSSGDEIVAFREKPSLDVHVSMGVYGVSRSALLPYQPGTPFGFDDLMHGMLGAGTRPHAVPFDGFWLDVGRPDDYDRANREFESIEPMLLGQTQSATDAA